MSAKIISKPEDDEVEDLGLTWGIGFEIFIAKIDTVSASFLSRNSEHDPSV